VTAQLRPGRAGNRRGAPGAPGPTGADMLRAVPRIRADAPGFLAESRQRWGEVVEFPMPRRPAFSVSDPQAVRRVLQDNHRNYDKATVQYRTLAVVTGQGLLTSDGPLWRRQRRLVQPAFHARTLDAVAARAAEAAGRVLAGWEDRPDGAVVDVDAAMMSATLDVVGQALFGTRLGAVHPGAGAGPGSAPGSAEALIVAVLGALDTVVARARSPLPAPAWAPTPRTRALRRHLRTLDATVAAVVAERRAAAERGAAGAGDLLDLLLAATDAEQGMDPRQLRDEIVTLVIAGHETVAAAMTWAWYLLAGDPAAAERLHREVDDVLGGRTAGCRPRLPTYADLPRLPWTRAVLDEALRLYPPAWVVTRRALGPDTLAGRDIPAGSLVILSPWVVHRHPGVWPDPERFDPGRFLPPRREEVPRHAYFPFGAGPRLCVGREFALVEGTVLLAALAARYRFDRVPGRAVRADALVTVRPHGGLPLLLTRR
jgi:cytochrome P450